jgi:hypothetical protein
MLKTLLQFVLVATMAIVGLVGLFIAWWIAVFAVVLVGAWIAWRRFFPRSPAGRAGAAGSDHQPVVIEGQFEVERDGESGRPAGEAPDGTGTRRVIDDRS